MSQKTVAFIVERLLDDRNFLIQFALEPLDTLAGVKAEGRELTAAEEVALVQADMQMWFWPNEKQGVTTTLRNVLVAFERSRQRTAVPIHEGIATTGGDRVTLVPALSSVEGSRYRVFDGGGSPSADDRWPTRRRRGFRWLLLALLCFVLAFVLGFATGHQQGAGAELLQRLQGGKAEEVASVSNPTYPPRSRP